ncbi:MAG TPA: 30S ribosomal protein S15 [Candidatus Coatesbacteria bacterium]|nr:30S ribosomal protein S15 [Candidatus Coatesbacteria bacterium]
MPLEKEQKAQIIARHGANDKDTGSTEVQVALLTARIAELTEHFKLHPKDHHGRRGLLKLVSKRRHLLNYLRRTEEERYRKLLGELGLRK